MGKPVALTGTAINSILTTLGNATGKELNLKMP